MRRGWVIAVTAAGCVAHLAYANPTGPVVANGQATFSTKGGLLSITNSPGAIINWQQFSIGAGETTRFIQQSADSAVLNRVVGGDPSRILGVLQSNGRVFLINPNGILFSRGAQVDVAGLVASSLSLSNADFIAGRLNFTGDAQRAAAVVNDGRIAAREGGRVYLVGTAVDNQGLVAAPNGDVVLAAGKSVRVTEGVGSGLEVEITAPADRALNLSALDLGSRGIYAGLVRNAGTITADAAVRSADGRIVLKASRDVTVEAGSRVSASGPEGGRIVIEAQAGAATVGGALVADGSTGRGGSVAVTGARVALQDGALVDASGARAGGSVLVGGDLHGAAIADGTRALVVAQQTDVAAGAQIRADAQVSGDGGRVVVWSDKSTRFAGSISARGGVGGGDGGTVEVSGKETLAFKGKVDTRAPKGRTGTLLLDPLDILIQAGTGDGDDAGGLSNSFAGSPSGAAGTVLATDTTPTILFQSELEGIAGSTNISLAATNSITIAALSGGNLNLAQTAGRSVSFQSGTFSMQPGDTITTAGGAVSITTTTGGATIGNLATGGGAVTLDLAGASSAGAISGAGTTLTKLGAGALTLNGASSYTGTTTVGAGTLALGASNVLPAASTLVVNGTGTLDIAGFNQSLAGVQLAAGTIAGSGGTLTSATAYDLRSGTVTAILGGAVGVNKSTVGTVTLSAANTYTGATSVTAGTLAVTANGALGGVGSGTTVEAGASLDLRNVAYGALEPLTLNGGTLATTNGTSSFANTVNLTAPSSASVTGTQLTLSGTVDDAGAGFTFTKTGAGTLAMGASNLFADTVRLVESGGTLSFAGFSDTVAGVQLLSGTISGSGGVLTSTTAFDLQTGAASVILAGGVGATKSGAGTVTLSGLNTYTGVTTVSGGILATGLLANGGLASGIGQSGNAASNLVLGSGGTLRYTGGSTSIDRNFTLSAGTNGGIDVAAAGTNLTLTGSAAATTGGLTKSGAGTLTLQNTHAYTGNTTVVNGTLALGASDRLADASPIVVNGGTLAIGGFDETQAAVRLLAGSITGTTGTLTSTSAFDLQSGTASAILAGAVGATKTTAGTVTLSGLNTYTGPTTINAGILSVGFLADGGLASNIGQSTSAAGNLVLGGGTLQYTGPSVAIDRSFTLTGATTSTIDVSVGATNLTLTGSGTGAGALTKAGVGTLTLQTPNTYTGLTTVSAGTLAYATDDALASGPVTVSGGTLDIGAFSDTVGAVTLVNGSIAGTTGVLTGTSYDVQNGSISAILAGAGALTKTTGGTVTLSGHDTYTGLTTVSAGTLALGANDVIADASSLVVSGGTFDIGAFNDTVAGVQLASGTITGTTGVLTSLGNYDFRSGTVSAIISGGVGIDKTTAGTVTLTRANTFTGDTNVIAGTLAVTANDALGTLAGGTTVEPAGTLDFQNVSYTTPEALTLHGGTIAASTGTSLFAGPVSLTANSTASVTGTQLTLSGPISESGGAFGLTKIGPALLVLSGGNTYTGNLQVDAGTVALNANDVLDDASSVTVNGGTFDIRTFTDTVGAVHLLSGTITGTSGVLTSTSNYDLRSGTVSAIINGGVGLDKTTAGTATLTRDNTYTGATAVNGGTLVVTSGGALGGTGAGTTVAAGATLRISSTAVGAEPVTLNGAGVGAAGALVGTGTSSLGGDVILATASTIGVTALADALALNGTIEGPGALTLAGAGTVTFGATVGAATPLASLTQNAATRLNVNGGLVRTVGGQTYNGSVTTGAPATLRTTANGAVAANGRFTATAGTLTLDTGAGNATLANPLNDFGTVTVTSGGAVSLADANGIALSGASAGSLLTRALGGNLTLNGGVTATGAGDSIVLVASGNFVNNAGALALTPGPGRWLVYSTNPAADTRGGLVYGFKQYNATYPATPVAQPAGNGFLYSLAPIVTPSLVGATTKVYDATTAATLVPANYTFIGAIDGDTVSLNNSTTGVYNDANVGAGKLVTATGLSISGASNGAAAVPVYGYQLAVTGASGNIGEITPRGLTVTPTNQAKTYGQTFVFNGTEFTSSGLQGGQTIGSVTLASAGAAPTASVAGSTYAITASAATGGTFNSGNYTITYGTGQLAVNPAPLTVTADNQVKAYGGSPFVFAGTEFTASGLQNGDAIASVTLVSPATSPTATVAGSPYPITSSAATGPAFVAGNYVITYVPGQFTVNIAGNPLTVTANNLVKPYGTTLVFAGTEFTASGLQNGETIGSVALASAGAPGAATVAGGPYALTPSSASGGTFNPANYTITYVDGQINVTRAPLVIRVDNQSRLMGLANLPFTVTYSGFVLGQGPAVLAGTLKFATTATASSGPGGYAISISGLTSADYAITFLAGLLGITARFEANDLIVALQRLGLWDLTMVPCLGDDAGSPAALARRGVGASPPRNCGPGAADTGDARRVKRTR